MTQADLVTIETLMQVCGYATDEPWRNNGYGCNHPDQEETQTDDRGKKWGCCYSWSCPIADFIDDDEEPSVWMVVTGAYLWASRVPDPAGVGWSVMA